MIFSNIVETVSCFPDGYLFRRVVVQQFFPAFVTGSAGVAFVSRRLYVVCSKGISSTSEPVVLFVLYVVPCSLARLHTIVCRLYLNGRGSSCHSSAVPNSHVRPLADDHI